MYSPRTSLVSRWVAALVVACAATAAHAGDCTSNFDLVGTQPEALFGEASSGTGDCDGDGRPDFAVGARLGGAAQEGRVFVYSGADGSLLYQLSGEQAGARFGSVVARLGDVDQDGRGDFLVTAPAFSDTWVSQGRVYVYSGRDGALLRTHTGEYDADFFGSQAVGLDDLDGDQVDDFAVSAMRHYPRGRVYLFSGASGALIRTLETDNDGSFGRTLARVDDLDGDGHADLLVGAQAFNRGTLHVISPIAGVTLAILQGEIDNDGFGVAAGMGDVNDDGRGDFLVGAAQANYVSLHSGADFTLLRRWFGDGEAFGSTLAGPGDIDQDGVEDALVGALTYLSGRGRAYLLSGATGEQLRVFEGVNGNDSLGWVSAPGDLNVDGTGEYIVGASRTDQGGTDSGRAWVYVSGASSWASYGQGHPGSHGIPDFTLSAPPVLGTTIELRIENSLELLTWGVLLIGTQEASIATPWGGTLLVVPSLLVPIQIRSTGYSQSVPIPSDPLLCRTLVLLQALEFDIGASYGYSFTPGVRALLGL